MSVSQVKKRFGEMEKYLGRDNEGLRRLKLLKDDVNVLRTSLAAAEKAADDANAVAKVARDRMDSAELVAEQLRVENNRITSLLKTMENRVKTLEDAQSENHSEDSDIETELEDIKGVEHEAKAVLKTLRKKQRIAPKPCLTMGDRKDPTLVFLRDEIASGWSHDAIWRLGAFAALQSIAFGRVYIKEKDENSLGRLRENRKSQEDWEKSGILRHIVQWSKNSVDLSKERPLRDAIEGIGRKPKALPEVDMFSDD